MVTFDQIEALGGVLLEVLQESPEPLIHEFCHAVTLGDPGLIVAGSVQSRIAHALNRETPQREDWDEVKALACEVVVFRILQARHAHREHRRRPRRCVGFEPCPTVCVTSLLEEAGFWRFTPRTALPLVMRLVECASTRRRALEVLGLLEMWVEETFR